MTDWSEKMLDASIFIVDVKPECGLLALKAEGDELFNYYMTVNDWLERRLTDHGYACLDIEQLYTKPDEPPIFYMIPEYLWLAAQEAFEK